MTFSHSCLYYHIIKEHYIRISSPLQSHFQHTSFLYLTRPDLTSSHLISLTTNTHTEEDYVRGVGSLIIYLSSLFTYLVQNLPLFSTQPHFVVPFALSPHCLTSCTVYKYTHTHRYHSALVLFFVF